MNNRKVLITGCSSGIGFYTALKFAREGFSVYASMRNIKSEGAQKLNDISNSENLNIKIVEIDVTKENIIEKTIKNIDEVDVLINNAGFGFYGPIESFSIDEVKEQFETNYFGTLRMLKAIIPLMRNKKSGTIINLSSINGLVSFPLLGIYSSSKFALETLTEALRFELKPFNIKVALIEPGTMLTNFSLNRRSPENLKNDSFYSKRTKSFLNILDKKTEHINKGNFLKKFINPEIVANKIYSVSQMNTPRLHNRVGIDSHLYYYGKLLLPNFIWNYLLERVYKY